MSDDVKLALIQMVGGLFTTIGVAVVAYITHGMKKSAKETHEAVRETKDVVTATSQTVGAIEQQTNGRLLRAEAEVAALKVENDRLLAELGTRRKEDAP